MAPPLAGKPPFATDLPDSVFADPPKATPRPRKQNVDTMAPGGPRESAYTTFDSYFTGGLGSDSRASGVGDIGRGLMNAGSDYDDSSDDEQPQPKKQAPPANNQPSDKHRALFAAATGGAPSAPPPPSYERGAFAATPEKQRSPLTEQASAVRTVRQPQAVVHAHANDRAVSHHAEPSTPPANTGRSFQQQQTPPMALQAGRGPLAAPAPRPPQAAFMQGQRPGMSPSNTGNPYFTGAGPMPGSPAPSTRTPQPLPPPQSPIMPVFARPRKESNAVKFDEKGGIMRGNSEETLLPRGTGGRGDDFWRRFSMVAKEEAKSGQKKSAWLKKTENGTTRLSAWVWIVGILLLVAIGGGIGLGWYFTHNKPAQQPVAIGGSANESFTSASSAAEPTASVKATKVTAAPVPTNTANNNERREKDVPTFVHAPAPAPAPVVPPAHRRSLINRIPH